MCNTQGDTPIRLKRRPIAQSIENLDQLMNLEKGRMSRDLFWDRDIYEQELEQVILAQGITTLDEYRTARRIGRSGVLSRSKRDAVWPVFEEYRGQLASRKLKEVDHVDQRPPAATSVVPGASGPA